MPRKRLKTPRRPKGDFMPDDTSKIMRRVISDPLAAAEAARDRYTEGEGNWRREMYEVLAVVYALGQFFRYHGSAWRRFITSPFFDFRKHPLRPIKDQPKAMRIVAYAVLNADSEAKRDRAAAYVRGLQVLARRNVRADDVVAEIIDAGGIEALIEAAKTDPTRPQPFKVSDKDRAEQQEYYDVSDEHGPGGAKTWYDAGDEPAAEPLRAKAASTVRSKEAFERGCDPKGRPTVEFETETHEDQEYFLDLRKRRSAWVLVESLGRSKDGWRRLKIRKFIPHVSV